MIRYMDMWNVIREDTGYRRLAMLSLLALVFWVGTIFIAMSANSMVEENSYNIDVSNKVINNGAMYKELRGGTAKTQVTTEEPLSVVSDIVAALELKEKVMQLQSNASGISIQLEQLYGEDLKELLTILDGRGIKVKNAEIRALPSGNDRLLAVSMMLEA